ncbi:methyltransferase [Amycolatopsis sp. NPDC049688]|uniref:class I SAM-dependent methyltransferase n=1 Tax=Amycolatopsis sp. NPDC049688 TaxID=3154733 RepID=UPI00342B3442
MPGHTHDDIDWADRLTQLRMADTLDASALTPVARRLVSGLPDRPTIVDVGCGAGGMSVLFARELARRGGGRVVLVDATPELLAEAERAVAGAADGPAGAGSVAGSAEVAAEVGRAVAGSTAGDGRSGGPPAVGSAADSVDVVEAGRAVAGPAEIHERSGGLAGAASAAGSAQVAQAAGEASAGSGGSVAGSVEVVGQAGGEASTGSAAGAVEVVSLLGDLADPGLAVPAADLVWASGVVHHVGDQQAALRTLAGLLRPGGVLAIGEGGLELRCLPWELGVGRPGLEQRLHAARAAWFARMRAGLPGSVAMPYGWTRALREAGLSDVESFGALIDHPMPGSELLREYVVHRIGWLADWAAEWLDVDDRAAVAALTDPQGPHFLGRRDDLYLFGAKAIHCGRSR